jgi:N-acetylmuramoyl-L-alanine amidase
LIALLIGLAPASSVWPGAGRLQYSTALAAASATASATAASATASATAASADTAATAASAASNTAASVGASAAAASTGSPGVQPLMISSSDRGASLVKDGLSPGPGAGYPSDVQGHWAAPEIASAISAGYVTGYPDSSFRPNAGVTRAEFTTMIALAFQLGAVSTAQDGCSFRDVHPGDWFDSAVQAAVSSGCVSGYPDHTFRPQRAVNRQEASCILSQALQLQGTGTLNFPDSGRIGAWARPFVARLAARGIIGGYPDGTLRPTQVISRAEAVVLISKALAAQGAPGGNPIQPADGSAAQGPAASRGQAVALNVRVNQGPDGVGVEVVVNQNVACQVYEQQNPQRLAVTVPGVTVVRSPLEIDVGAGGVDKVTTSWSGGGSGAAEVDISFTAPVPLTYYNTQERPGGMLITVPPQIYKIETAPVSDFLAVNLWATAPLDYQASVQSNPSQIVFAFPGFSLCPGLQRWQQRVNTAGVESLQLGEPRPMAAQLVAQAAPGIVYSGDNSTDGQQLVLRLQQGAGPVPPGGQSNLAGKTIVLDPGHGGNDPGALGPDGVQEKSVNLAIASKAAEILRQQGADVIMTRTGDTNPDLYARPDLANKDGADVFVSIHANSAGNRSTGGTGTYTYAPPGTSLGRQRAARLRLADDLQESLLAALGLHSCGIFERNFAVLRCSNMPAALVEVAFISNPREERLLNDAGWQEQAAAGIASGITRFLTGS